MEVSREDRAPSERPTRILVIDDEETYARTLRRLLHRWEPAWHIDYITSAQAGIMEALHGRYDLVLIDYHLNEDLTGLDILRQVRRSGGRAALVILTGRVECEGIATAMEALREGADGYILKRHGPEHLHRTIRLTLARRPYSPRALDYPPFRVELGAHRAFVAGMPLRLTPHQSLLFVRLVELAGEIAPHRELCELADIEPANHYKNLHNEIQRLRRRIAEVMPGAESRIETVHGVGYRLRRA